MSTSQFENFAVATNFVDGKVKKHSKKMSSLPVERKTLQTLQLSAEQGCLTRPGQQLKHKDGKDKSKGKIVLSKKPLFVFEDPKPASIEKTDSENMTKPSVKSAVNEKDCTCECHQKTEEEEMYDFMTAEPSLNEWKDLAEERRQALDESLVENRQLHFEVSEFKTQVSTLSEEVDDLESENRRLSQQRDYFASILEKLVNDDNEEEPPSSPSDAPDSAVSESAFISDESESS